MRAATVRAPICLMLAKHGAASALKPNDRSTSAVRAALTAVAFDEDVEVLP